MSRYIDADALESELFRDGIAGIFLSYPRRRKFTIGEIRGMLKNERIAPTEDVVPRSEVEELQKKLDDYKKFVGEIRVTSENHAVIIDTEHTEYIDKRVAEGLKNLVVKQAKQEVAREIFEEIHKEIELALDSNYKARQEHIDKHFKGTLYTYDNFISLVDGKIQALRGIDDFLAELKKKYIGE